jgi:hypothetical protein
MFMTTRTRGRRRIAFSGLVLACGLAVATAAAIPALGADAVKVPSKITMPPNSPAFHGRVKSANDDCVKHRKVKLFKKRNGQDKLLGKDKTNHNGRWQIRVEPLKSGAYYAKALRSKDDRNGTTLICKGATSLTAHIH